MFDIKNIWSSVLLATNPQMLNSYFDLLEEHIQKLGLSNKPGQIFNIDESGMPLTLVFSLHEQMLNVRSLLTFYSNLYPIRLVTYTTLTL